MDHPRPGAPSSGHFHAVRFYEDDRSLCRIVANFLADGLVERQPAIVIATPSHREMIVGELKTRSPHAGRGATDHDLLLLDLDETLAACMVTDVPDRERFRASIGDALARARRGRADCTVRAYGEMVDILWKHGNADGAIRLEMLWNQLAMTHAFSLLCGYSMGHFYEHAGFQDVCRQHTHVVSETGCPAAIGA